ncbi:MAG: substrate-binding domain-containing protein [Pseudomonadota bacterium]
MIKYPSRVIGLISVLLACSVILPACGFAAELKLGGTGTDLGAMRIMADAFQKRSAGTAIVIQPSVGSAGGISAVLAGALDIAISSRPLKDEERALGAKEWAYAKTPLVFATDQKSPQTQLTSAEITGIYDGTVTQWRNGTAVRIILRPETDTDTVILGKHIPGMDAAMKKAYQRRGPPIAMTDQNAADNIQMIAGAVGPSTLALILGESRPLKALAFNGIAPTVENISNGTYPMTKSLYLVTGPHPRAETQHFIDFMRSHEGAAILRRTGHLVLAPNK